jgi:hypothetical protein
MSHVGHVCRSVWGLMVASMFASCAAVLKVVFTELTGLPFHSTK